MTIFTPKYSLWLRPIQIQIDEFSNIISEIAHRNRTTPFPPHITLLSGLTSELNSIKQACEKIIDRIHNFEIPMQNIAYTAAFYRNLYILAETTSLLETLYEEIKCELTYKENDKFVPHLSLLYGDLDLKTKKRLKDELNECYSKSFKCVRLDIYNTTGEIQNWHLIHSYEFSQSKK